MPEQTSQQNSNNPIENSINTAADKHLDPTNTKLNKEFQIEFFRTEAKKQIAKNLRMAEHVLIKYDKLLNEIGAKKYEEKEEQQNRKNTQDQGRVAKLFNKVKKFFSNLFSSNKTSTQLITKLEQKISIPNKNQQNKTERSLNENALSLSLSSVETPAIKASTTLSPDTTPTNSSPKRSRESSQRL